MPLNEQLQNFRHSCAHLLAAAVKQIWPQAKNAIGPAIEDGFYQDFDMGDVKIPESDLPLIEKKMRELMASWHSFEVREVPVEQARKDFADNPYKLELIEDFAKLGETITENNPGNFLDLCKGGHAADPQKELQHFKLLAIAGAYWRGDEKNKMLTRIYGTCFPTKEELDKHLAMLEEAKKRDHRKIGQEQKLFFIDEMVGKGLVMWLPNGTIIRNEVERLALEREDEDGYERVITPHLAKEELFLTSGHLPYYKDSMYPPMEMDDGVYYMKAMNCPHHHRIYLHEPKSYRDLPLRLAEYGTVYRNERSGTLAGLLRVRGLAMNDAHIYCRKDQIADEFRRVLALTIGYFKIFGLKDYYFRLSKWHPAHTDKYINEPENWTYAEGVLRDVLTEMKVPFFEAEDEAAFYGPKVDVQFRSVIGREETMSTIQLDFAAKSRFGLNYTDHSGKENNEVFVIHRAPLSTHERFLAFLIEHYGGAWPVWLSPVQVQLIPVSEKHKDGAARMAEEMKAAGIMVAIDAADETVGNKVRKAAGQKVPYIVVVGDKELAGDELSVRVRGEEAPRAVSRAEFVARVQREVNERSFL